MYTPVHGRGTCTKVVVALAERTTPFVYLGQPTGGVCQHPASISASPASLALGPRIAAMDFVSIHPVRECAPVLRVLAICSYSAVGPRSDSRLSGLPSSLYRHGIRIAITSVVAVGIFDEGRENGRGERVGPGIAVSTPRVSPTLSRHSGRKGFRERDKNYPTGTATRDEQRKIAGAFEHATANACEETLRDT